MQSHAAGGQGRPTVIAPVYITIGIAREIDIY